MPCPSAIFSKSSGPQSGRAISREYRLTGGDDGLDLYVYCSNLYDVIMANAEPLYLWETYVGGGIDGTRGNGVLNGVLAPDYDGDDPRQFVDDDGYDDDDGYEDADLDGPQRGEIPGYHWCDGCEVYHAD